MGERNSSFPLPRLISCSPTLNSTQNWQHWMSCTNTTSKESRRLRTNNEKRAKAKRVINYEKRGGDSQFIMTSLALIDALCSLHLFLTAYTNFSPIGIWFLNVVAVCFYYFILFRYVFTWVYYYIIIDTWKS